jgi:hypothetical protein
MKESLFTPGLDEIRRGLAHDAPQSYEAPVGPIIDRLTSVCRQRRCVETLDNVLKQQENRATYWSSKDVIG